jgi:para-aminobenzoate synthetase component 1
MSILPIPFRDPVAAFAPFAGEDWAMLLDGARPGDPRGRYATIAARPWRTLTSRDGVTEVDGNAVTDDPFTALAALLAGAPACPGPVPFPGGAVGWIGYEAGRHLERAPARHRLGPGRPDVAVGLYDAILAFDLAEGRAWAIAARPEAEGRARLLADIAAAAPDLADPPPPPDLVWRADLSRDAYLERVERAIELIRAGDVFQVNLTGRMVAARPAGVSDFALYRRLRAANPAPFAAFLRGDGGFAVASASPERFVALSSEGRIEARPIKGTRRRSADPDADRRAAAELAASGKDRAENLMIVDLLRSDIGRVAALGSVRVPVLCGLERTASLHHLVSVVEGTLRPGLGAADLLRATFPGGSVTGAPKIRAMEIIDELEPAARGPYCGAAVWIGFDGAMDSSILIRTLVLDGDEIVAQAGGGIVADSDPAAEYDEMRAKVEPALSALAEGGVPAWFIG